MKDFRQTLEQLLPNEDYQEQWLDETCFNLLFISKIIEMMISQEMDITKDDLAFYARMPIDVMIEKKPELLKKVLTAIQKHKIGTVESTPEYIKIKVEQWMQEVQSK